MARFQLDLSAEGLEEIEVLMEETDTPTKREYVNSALTLLKWAIRHRQKGSTIAAVSQDDGVYRELEMPILDHASVRAARRAARLTEQNIEED